MSSPCRRRSSIRSWQEWNAAVFARSPTTMKLPAYTWQRGFTGKRVRWGWSWGTPDPAYFADGGNTSLWACGTLPSTAPRGFHSIFEFGMLGFGIPAGIGGRAGNPARESVVLTGDGAAGYHVMEMQTAAREKIKVT
ncbi:MAG: hypothetical protein KC442_22145, partial [Thermomicrobiales bacterium]|nr:hypothetical protein [Thermomicrobiales bacterium]